MLVMGGISGERESLRGNGLNLLPVNTLLVSGSYIVCTTIYHKWMRPLLSQLSILLCLYDVMSRHLLLLVLKCGSAHNCIRRKEQQHVVHQQFELIFGIF